jgi:hypothetical protein
VRAAATARAGTLVAGLALAATLFAPARARAQDILEEDGSFDGPHRYRSPQHWAFELKFGPYRPDVDSEFDRGGTDVRTPYKDFFGGGRHLLTQLEVDWQVFHRVGTIAVGAGLGYFSVSGAAPLGNGTGLISGDSSELKVVPFSVTGVYRFDYLLETRDFPLVPYGKFGLDYAYWQITDGNDEIARDGTGTGRGGTRGWHAAAGLELVLDIFDPEAARDFDADLGVNHTAIVFEYAHVDLSGLGQANRLHLGDTTWSLGLLLEF